MTRVAVVYAVVGVGTAEAAQLVFEALELPRSASQVLTLLILFGFPIALVLAWALEVTPDGIRRTQPAEAVELGKRAGGRWSSAGGWALAALALAFIAWRLGVDDGSTPEALAAIAGVEASMARGDLLDAYQRARALPDAVPDSTRRSLLATASESVSFATQPPGAHVSWRPYADPEAAWESLGSAPIDWLAPREAVVLRVEAEGYVPREVMNWPSLFPLRGTELRRVDDVEPNALQMRLPPDLVEVIMQLGDARLARAPARDLGAFLIDRYETTNRQYQEFVSAGGYERRQYWEQPLVRNGRTLAWEDGMTALVDRTGRPGPATWVGGAFPEGTADYPVTGISWYEAMAYARFRGRDLPTLYHWFVTAYPFAAEWIVPLSNISG